ncbi:MULTISPECIES: FAD-dependent oxidoreductase [unclassified Mesorhizobium]|uniref:GcvT family protein n=1 Tax=unclassified Mesorhizobium TaxID=325217 RepID=UPI000FCA4CE8|nr:MULTISPECIES: FAD-dependent oxidoreductase [unclassified Mesorhizobium]WIE88973.1 FAD-dependent oxidoreductase [Mesorhizobium sp. WSM4875]MDG4886302.1 FAD-dependent oxidoreductase [Mesorhizobium sp. WSM4887]RUW00506.1 FAD-dependent oxidoreductase [Mesorhizobium sp. M1A.F.Ca.IN.020.04.1.1]RUW05600.1 FAD-dependent oxidoreductase [Mesorhizobium sp. M1A.F.Ca.IN.020.03.1.1]RWF74499.1 MAG: FAD-dependent oxidoreductase [Mesorhizobium sp.]
MKSHVKAVVIGGGVVGCSVLYHLAKAGWTDIMLIERSELTSGSSWHAAGGFHTLNGDPNVAKLQAYTVQLYKEIEELSGQSCSLHLTGGVMMADTPERMDFLRLAHAKGRYLGMDTELITPSEAKAMFPLMDEKNFVGAMWDPVEGHLDPSGTTHAYAKAARKLGAEIVLRNRVVELTQEADGTWNVVTEQGTVKAEHVVNCGGLWAREIGRMVGVELPVLAMEHMYLLTEPMPEVEEFNRSTGREMIGVLDFKGEIYTRQERNGILLGTYEKACKPWSPVNTPWDFGHELLPPDIDRIAPSLEIGFKHFPGIEKAGIKQIINGPFTFALDGNPLVGPVQGLTNFWCACAVMAGFSQGGGVGLALSNWMVHGDPGFDVWGMDVARFGEWATLRYTNAKVRENYSRRFSIRFPNEELPAARPAQTTPLYDTMLANNAVMGDSWGLETPLWFAPKGTEPKDIVSFHRSNDFGPIGEEVRATRERVGVTEIANFAKYEVSGPGAEDFLNRLMTNRMPKTGRIVLTPMVNEFGRLIGDFTIAKTGEDRFMIWGSSAAQKYHMRWFEKHLPKDGSVRIHRFDQTLVGLSIAGPSSRDLLQKLVDVDVSTKAFRFMDFREMAVGGAPCMVNRITYTGDLGYEIWMAPAYQRLVYKAIKEAGEEFGLVDFGMRALLSMRLEKNFPTWFRELRPIYGPFEGSMDRFIKLEKNDFIGREAAAREQAQGPKLRRVSFIVDAADADVMGDEPIWAKVSKDYGTVEKPHGYGAPRFDETGKEVRGSEAAEGASAVRGIVDGEWRVVGWVTSGGYAHYVQKSMAQGYVPAALAEDESAGLFEIEILGHRRPARINVEPPFDPSGEKMRT